MKTDRIILILVLVLIIFVAIVALFIYKTYTPGTNIRYDLDDVHVQDGDLLSPSNSNTGTNTPGTSGTSATEPKPSTDAHNGLDECIALKASEAKGKQYVKGSLIVSFFDAVSFSTAVDSMKLLGLTADSSTEAKINYDQYHWLQVAVPSGDEFKWQCIFDASEGVRRSTLNTTFSLRQ